MKGDQRIALSTREGGLSLVFIYIGAGGFLGAIFRYILSGLMSGGWAGAFPVGTLIANLLGSFLLGFCMVLSMEIYNLNPAIRMGIATGFLGGLTTFSTFAYETVTLVDNGLNNLAFWYVTMSVVLCLAAVWLGTAMGRTIPLLNRKARQGWGPKIHSRE